MKNHASRMTAILAAAAVATHGLVAIAAGVGVLALLVFAGIAMPAVWSENPARRAAATNVLERILDTLRRR